MALTPTVTIPRASDGANGDIDFIDGSTTLYVSTTGSDTNAGTEASPFLTVQHALDTAGSAIISPGSVITIQLADGTYSTATSLVFPKFIDILVNGNAASITSTVLRVSSAVALANIGDGMQFVTLANLTMDASVTSAQGVFVGSNSRLLLDNVRFGANLTNGQILLRGTSFVSVTNGLTIAGSAAQHLSASGNCEFNCVGQTVTLVSTPAFSTRFALSQAAFVRYDGCSFVGGATGTRYLVDRSGILFTNGAGATFLPGNVNGSIATQGQYL